MVEQYIGKRAVGFHKMYRYSPVTLQTIPSFPISHSSYIPCPKMIEKLKNHYLHKKDVLTDLMKEMLGNLLGSTRAWYGKVGLT